MKKLYTLLFIAAPLLMIGQNKVTNPTFDNGLTGWTAGPTSAYTSPTIAAADGSNGSNSATYVAPTATTGFYQEIPVTAGNQIVVSYSYKSSGDGSDARIWSSYKDASGNAVYQNTTTTSDPLRSNNAYLANAAIWTNQTMTLIVPATAVTLVLAFRAYIGSTVSFDDISVVETTLGAKQNEIAGLSMYPNPVKNGTLFITSNSDAAKTVAVFDILGKQVLNTKSVTNAVNVSNLKNGVYILKITEDGKTDTKKLVIE